MMKETPLPERVPATEIMCWRGARTCRLPSACCDSPSSRKCPFKGVPDCPIGTRRDCPGSVLQLAEPSNSDVSGASFAQSDGHVYGAIRYAIPSMQETCASRLLLSS